MEEWAARTMRLLQQSSSAVTLRDTIRLLTIAELSLKRADIVDVCCYSSTELTMRQMRLNAMSTIGGDAEMITHATTARTEVMKLAEEMKARLMRASQQHEKNYSMTEGCLCGMYIWLTSTEYLVQAAETAAWIRDKRFSVDDRILLDSVELVETYIGEVDSILQQLAPIRVSTAVQGTYTDRYPGARHVSARHAGEDGSCWRTHAV